MVYVRVQEGKSHTSGQSVVQLAVPEDGEKAIKPSDLAAYIAPNIDIAKIQIEEVEKLSGKISSTIFGVDLNKKPNVAVTATENQNYYDTAYDVLHDFTKSPISAFVFCVNTMAEALGVKDAAPRLVSILITTT